MVFGWIKRAVCDVLISGLAPVRVQNMAAAAAPAVSTLFPLSQSSPPVALASPLVYLHFSLSLKTYFKFLL